MENITTSKTVERTDSEPLNFAYVSKETTIHNETTPVIKEEENAPQNTDAELDKVAKDIPFTQATASDPLTKKKPNQITVALNEGETLMGLLRENGASRNDAYYAIESLRPFYNPRSIKIGQEFTLYYKSDENNERQLDSIKIETSPIISYLTTRNAEGSFETQKHEKELTAYYDAASGTIDSSLSVACDKAGVPVKIVHDLIQIYSWDLDFQRDVQQGDQFEILYERSYDDEGTPLVTGNIVYANLKVHGEDIKIYRQELKDGTIEYFKEDGISVKRQLMRTPINGARISSGFGMRKHPILGYSKKHSGLDFAAPRGTPIFAAGDGVIERAGRNGSYGNYVRIRHRSGLKTAYAHMKNIAKDIKNGVRVKQKQIIGYVGSTGRSTGPHLHYEVIKDGQKVNPARVDLPTGIELKGTNLANLKNTMKRMKQRFADASKNGRIKVASR